MRLIEKKIKNHNLFFLTKNSVRHERARHLSRRHQKSSAMLSVVVLTYKHTLNQKPPSLFLGYQNNKR
jgi:hypothetical protein